MTELEEVYPVILDTDIGVDIDDDLAVLTLLGIIKKPEEKYQIM